MANVQDKQLAIARVYARSVLELAGSEEARGDVVGEFQALVTHAAENADFQHFISSPLVDPVARSGSLEKLFRGQMSDLAVDALQVINRKGRLALLPAIAAECRREAQGLRGRIDAQVTTAVALGDQLRAELELAIESWVGKPADLEEAVDPQLIGGMVLRIGDRRIDRTVSQDLHGLRAALHDRASRAVHDGYFDQGQGADG